MFFMFSTVSENLHLLKSQERAIWVNKMKEYGEREEKEAIWDNYFYL